MRLLFVCVHNAGRSVMAEAFAQTLGGHEVEALSAGTMPSPSPHAVVVEAMAEVGIDVSGHSGRLLDDDLVRSADRVITMGCAVDADACPAIRYAALEDWGLPDPAGQPVETVRRIRDEIDRSIQKLVDELTPWVRLGPPAALPICLNLRRSSR